MEDPKEIMERLTLIVGDFLEFEPPRLQYISDVYFDSKNTTIYYTVNKTNIHYKTMEKIDGKSKNSI